jgi:hypothetical protein
MPAVFAIAATGEADLTCEFRISGGAGGDCPTAEEIAEQVRIELSAELTWLSELHLIHGLRSGSPLSVTQTSRIAGVVEQTIAESAGDVTVTRG